MMSSSRPFTRAMIGVLHEPTQFGFSPGFSSPELPPGSFACQTVWPVALLAAIRKVRSPGPKFAAAEIVAIKPGGSERGDHAPAIRRRRSGAKRIGFVTRFLSGPGHAGL